jgi:hypothetical protein
MAAIMLEEAGSYKVKKLASSERVTAKSTTNADKDLIDEAVEN